MMNTKSISKMVVNGRVGYCVNAETKEDAIKMLELYMENERLKDIISNLEDECAELEMRLPDYDDDYDDGYLW